MKRILVCLDASMRASSVLATATELARRLGAKLRLLRVVGLPPEIDQEMYVQSAADLIEALKSRARTELAMTARTTPEDLIDSMDVVIGVPWDAICREAKSVDADLVVIGSHGYSGFDRILGTTAAKVVNHCDRSVLVVRNLEAGAK